MCRPCGPPECASRGCPVSDWLRQAWPEPDAVVGEEAIQDSSTVLDGQGSHGAELTDKGNADLLRDKLVGGSRWCADLRTWIHYTGRRWEKQPDAGVVREAAAELDLSWGDSSRKADDLEKARARHYKYSRSDRGVSAMVSLLRDQAVMRVNSADLDGYTYELNTPDASWIFRLASWDCPRPSTSTRRSPQLDTTLRWQHRSGIPSCKPRLGATLD